MDGIVEEEVVKKGDKKDRRCVQLIGCLEWSGDGCDSILRPMFQTSISIAIRKQS